MLTLSRDVTVTDVENGSVVLDARRGRYFQLNATAAATLRMLLGGDPPERAAARIAEAAPVTPERALSDVLALLDSLKRAKLVVTR